MILSLSPLRSTVSRFSLLCKLTNHLQSPSCAHLRLSPILLSSISTTPTSSTPQIPLFLRQSTFSATSSDLKEWHNWAKNLAFSVGSKFSDIDNGPDVTILCRELQWFLEDAIEDYSATWASSESEKLIRLRINLEELYLLWKQRIVERRPFQYIVGCEHWKDLILSVQEGVLIPRPETELIVDLVEKVVLEDECFREGLWVDLGTGSGALAIAIARILGTQGRVIATDLSPIAAAVSEFNVKRYDLQNKVEIRQGSWFEPLADVKGQFVGLVSNPPYIPANQMCGLQAEVGKHEPKLALDGGEKGLDDLLHLCEGAASMLKPGGFFAFETNGEKQSKFLQDFMRTHPENLFRDVKIVADFAGIDRFVTGFCY